jgi:hypothetical protein
MAYAETIDTVVPKVHCCNALRASLRCVRGRAMNMLSRVEYEDFVAARGDAFTLGHDDNAVELVLAEISARQSSVDFESFSLYFHDSPGKPVAQGLVEFSHPRLGALEIFLVPIKLGAGRVYEAVFHRFIAAVTP